MSEEEKSFVLDIGSHRLQYGEAGDDAPRLLVPSVVATETNGYDSQSPEFDIDELLAKTPYQQIDTQYESWKYPIQRGIIQDFDDFEKILMNICYLYDPSKQEYQLQGSRFLFTEATLNPLQNQSKINELLFEKCNVSATYCRSQNYFSWMGSGRNTVLSVHLGSDLTTIEPYFDATTCRPSITRLAMGGSDIADYFTDLITSKGHYFTYSSTQGKRTEYRSIKRELMKMLAGRLVTMASTTQCAEYFDTSKEAPEKQFKLPDGYTVTINNEGMQAAELLHHPYKFLPNVETGLVDAIINSIHAAPADVQSMLYGNIVLTGGVATMPGLKERLQEELTLAAPSSTKVRIISNFEAVFTCWIGGSITASLSTMQQLYLTKSQYEEGVTTVPTIWK